ncbi:hypothetical protein ACUXVY_22900, partial [Chromobacterium haemolyticum]|uniref:hypothetical protein n=1 Tax=Chromobacterium haemolyticum TaxID=394935 RepID=UPI004055ABEC
SSALKLSATLSASSKGLCSSIKRMSALLFGVQGLGASSAFHLHAQLFQIHAGVRVGRAGIGIADPGG